MNHTALATGSAPSTKERILDAAERLLAKQGFESTSLRAITTEAEVNLAAVNYHFQTKEALFRAVIARRFAPVNERRNAMLDGIEAEAGDGALPVARVIEAFIRPVLEVRGRSRNIAPIVGRVFAENDEFTERFFQDHLAAVTRRFLAALTRATPHLPREEMMWRAHFLVGAMAHNMITGEFFEKISEGLCRASDIEGLVRQMVGVFTTVFEAPSTEKVEHEA